MTEAVTTQSLAAALTDMQALSSGALAHIRGMARCALRALETPSGARDLESIAEVLEAIAQEAEITHNNVGVEAERVGVETHNAAWMRRLEARPKRHSPLTDDAQSGRA